MSYFDSMLVLAPIGYWRLGESAGVTASDSSGNSHDLTYVNTPSLSQPGGIVSDSDTGVLFERANNESADGGAISALQLIGDLTVMYWQKVSSLPANSVFHYAVGCGIAGETEATNTVYLFGITQDSDVPQLSSFHENGAGTNNLLTWTYTSSITEYEFIAFVRDVSEDTIEAFVNGISLGTQSYANDPTGGSSATMSVGQSPASNNQEWDGVLDEVAVFDKTLTAAQIESIYSEGRMRNNNVLLRANRRRRA